mgnify:CR=1 FL=1
MPAPETLWTDAEIDLLGTDTDRAVAAQTGRTETAVRMKRRELGIAAHARNDPRHWTKREIKLLGTMPDREVAQRLGCTRLTVIRKRKELEIEAFAPECAPKAFR